MGAARRVAAPARASTSVPRSSPRTGSWPVAAEKDGVELHGCEMSIDEAVAETTSWPDIMTDVSSANSMAGIQAGDELAKKRR